MSANGRISDYSGPTCQFSDCPLEGTEEKEHPEHGDVDVCDTHADLWD